MRVTDGISSLLASLQLVEAIHALHILAGVVEAQHCVGTR